MPLFQMAKESRKLVAKFEVHEKCDLMSYASVHLTEDQQQITGSHQQTFLMTLIERLKLEKLVQRTKPTSADLSGALAFSNTSESV
jgi:hypothetical protein